MDAIFAGLLAFLVTFAVLAFAFGDNSAARHHAFQKANAICGPKGADGVDIQGENRIAFVCRKDVPALRTLGY